MFIIVMGVSGSGKTTVGLALAHALRCPFYDGDDYHPPANIAKMAAGLPLNDDDRAGWLAALADVIRAGLARGEQGVIACSALKQKYRATLRSAASCAEQVRFVYLKGSYSTIMARMQSRQWHYMQPGMLQSQFDALEEPINAVVVDITLEPEEVVRQILAQLTELSP
jgi:carbohydrate kinase (thermoresistant glucokinase family)